MCGVVYDVISERQSSWPLTRRSVRHVGLGARLPMVQAECSPSMFQKYLR
jgi:hypothetical protein